VSLVVRSNIIIEFMRHDFARHDTSARAVLEKHGLLFPTTDLHRAWAHD